MATSSILNTVHINDNKRARNIISILENSTGNKSKYIELSRTHEDVKRDNIKEFLIGDLPPLSEDYFKEEIPCLISRG